MQPESLAHYRILRPLGSGGMGEVFLAEDTRLNRKVALKLLRQDQAEGEAGRKRLLREAQAAAQLDHPNACAIYEVGESELGTYIAMQFIEGESLSDLMSRQRLALPVLLDIGIQVADALAEAHTRGLVHRDIKPQNIMVTAKGQAKVLDFGLAKRMEAIAAGETHTLLTNPGMVLGTVPYMSPEQVKAEELDGRSDVFSLGAVLFEVATGRRPFEAHSSVELMAMILTHDPFDAADPSLPLNPELRRILQRALAKDLPARYQGARELREDLMRLRALVADAPGDEATTLRRLAFPGGTAGRARRKAWAVGLGAALLVGCVVSTYAWFRTGRSVDSIAVLPIVNESGDANADYVSDGLTENLIQQLSHLRGLKVIARSSILRYKGRNADPATVGRELGVQTVLVGRMRTRDGQLLLNLELADAREQSRLWGTQLQRPASDLVAIQDDLAHELSRHLGRPSQTADLQSLDQARVKTSSAQAYDLYLKGRFYADRMVPTEVERALGYFDQALALDPGFALARVGKANAYWNMSSTFRSADEMMPKAKAEAELALKADPNQAEALIIRGITRLFYDRDPRGSNEDFLRALGIAPSNPAVLQTYGYALMNQGRSQEGIPFIQKAIQGDPMSPFTWMLLCYAQQTAGDFAASNRSAEKVLALDPEFFYARLLLGLNHLYLGRNAEALKELKLAADSGSNLAIAARGKALGLTGHKAEAREILRFLESPKAREASYVSPIHLALVHLGLGERDKAMALVNRALEIHEEDAIAVPALRHWKELRSAPGYPAFLAKLRAQERSGS